MPGFQIGGLSSGLQTGQIIDAMMDAERQPVVRMETKVAILSARKKAFEGVKAQFTTFKSKLDALMLPTTFNTKTASVQYADGAKSSAVAVKAGGDAALGSFQVWVDQLATATSASSANRVGSNVNAAVALKNAGLTVPVTTSVTDSTTGTFTINGTAVSVDHNVDTLNDVVARINSTVAGVTATLVDANGVASGTGNYLKLSSATAVTVGSGADTSNFLSAVGLLSAQAKGATVTGAVVSAGGLGAGEFHIDGVIIPTRATAVGSTSLQNATSVAADINSTPGVTVIAKANSDGTLSLVSKTRGVGTQISVAFAPGFSGISAGTTTQATDERVSAGGIGGTQTGVALTSSRLITALTGLDGSGNGSFKINGVTIDYSQNDTLTAVLSRINASGAGVNAIFDTVLDRVTFTAKGTGSTAISFQDTTGNLLAAVGATTATQAMGKNALYRVSSVNGGASMSSNSNTVTGIIPGVELSLQQASPETLTVTIGQQPDDAIKAIKDFVDVYNFTVEVLKNQTKGDPKGIESGVLNNDSTLATIETSMRKFLTAMATGLAGSKQTLSEIGITFGKVGSAVGTANKLEVDETKLRAALNASPQTVNSLLSGFQSTATLVPGGTGAVASITGSPLNVHQPGSYLVTTTASGSISAVFTPTGGTAGSEKFGGTFVANGTDSQVIPGLTITAAGTLVNGTHTINVAVQQKGLLVDLADFVESVVGTGGLLATRKDNADKATEDLNKRITRMEERLAQKRLTLERQFAQLERLMAGFQAQQASLAGFLTNNARSAQ